MACILVPAAEAVVTSIAAKVVKSKEQSQESARLTLNAASAENADKVPFSRKLKWLSNMLWGGTALLAFEHVWHGEIVPYFPFLSAAANPADAANMLREMATVGVSMSLIVTAVWAGMVAVTSAIVKRGAKAQTAEN